MNVIYVVTWRHTDGSGSGAVSAHWTKEGAERMAAIVNALSDRTFNVEAVPCEPLP